MSPRRTPPSPARSALAALAALVLAWPLLAGCGDTPDDPDAAAEGAREHRPGAAASGTARNGPAPTGSAAVGTAPGVPGQNGPTHTGRPGNLPALTAPGTWLHRPGLTWQWQLTGPLDLKVDADVYELDGFTTPAAAVSLLRTAGRRTICYISVGAYEHFRPDAHRFPAPVLGRSNGWPGERWVDVRQWRVLEPIISERFRMCRDKGFDAVEADNVDGYANESGFPLRAPDQLEFNRRVAALAHSYRLAIGLKNDLGQVAALEPHFDFAVNEECFRYGECDRLAPFVRAGKPVFHVEYDLAAGDFCARARAKGFASLLKRSDLDAWRIRC